MLKQLKQQFKVIRSKLALLVQGNPIWNHMIRQKGKTVILGASGPNSHMNRLIWFTSSNIQVILKSFTSTRPHAMVNRQVEIS